METRSLPYRAWSISSIGNWDTLEKHLDRALAEAPRHKITCIEIQDFVPQPSWGDVAAQYRNWPRLAAAQSLYGGRRREGALTTAQRMESAERLRKLAGRVRAAGLELQVWYHCLRDWPPEAIEWYPELDDPDSPALYRFLEETLDDAFAYFPEITGITVSSLHETKSVTRMPGATSQAERMERMYRSLADVCARRGRRLILRDFIARWSELQDFDHIVDRLPPEVIIQTKDVMGDWSAHEKPVNPWLFRYLRKPRRTVVEFELANNYTGETEMPWCDPEQIWRHIRTLAELGGHGAVGRIVNARALSSGTIFDTPNEVDVWAFSRALADPGRMLQKPGDAWWHDYDHMDHTVWTDWARERFGPEAASEAIHALRLTPRLLELSFNVCGAFFWLLGHHMRLHQKAFDNWAPAVIAAIERCGADHARSEKREAAAMIEQALARLAPFKDRMPAGGWARFAGAYERARHILRIHAEATEGVILAMEIDAGRGAPTALRACCDRLRAAAAEMETAYGVEFYERSGENARRTADFIQALPGRIASLRGNRGLYE